MISATENKRDYVADFLSQEYLMDKTGTREALFGRESDMKAELKGPWGSYVR